MSHQTGSPTPWCDTYMYGSSCIMKKDARVCDSSSSELWCRLLYFRSPVRPSTQWPLSRNAIAIESEASYPNGGTVYYVTMQITLSIPEFTRNERDLHCDVLHITTDKVARLVLDDAIAAIQMSRYRNISNGFSPPLFLHIMWMLSLLMVDLLLYDILRCAGNKLNKLSLNYGMMK